MYFLESKTLLWLNWQKVIFFPLCDSSLFASVAYNISPNIKESCCLRLAHVCQAILLIKVVLQRFSEAFTRDFVVLQRKLSGNRARQSHRRKDMEAHREKEREMTQTQMGSQSAQL